MMHLKIKNRLKASGLTVTKNRIRVFKCFTILDKPLTLKQIRAYNKDIDRVTIFRILKVFEQKQIIHLITLDHNKILYALCDQECSVVKNNHSHQHLHFQCDNCHDVSCLSIDEFPLIKVPNYRIDDISINVNGLCQMCNI